MKKLSFFVVTLLGVLMILASATSTTPATGRVGYVAPQLNFVNNGQQTSLQQFRGKIVLLTLWSTTDPVSRLHNKEYTHWCESHNGVAHIALDLDRSAAVWTATLKADGITARDNDNLQARLDEEQRSRLSNEWHVDRSLNSYLIGTDGTIIAINPTQAQLDFVAASI